MSCPSSSSSSGRSARSRARQCRCSRVHAASSARRFRKPCFQPGPPHRRRTQAQNGGNPLSGRCGLPERPPIQRDSAERSDSAASAASADSGDSGDSAKRVEAPEPTEHPESPDPAEQPESPDPGEHPGPPVCRGPLAPGPALGPWSGSVKETCSRPAGVVKIIVPGGCSGLVLKLVSCLIRWW